MAINSNLDVMVFMHMIKELCQYMLISMYDFKFSDQKQSLNEGLYSFDYINFNGILQEGLQGNNYAEAILAIHLQPIKK